MNETERAQTAEVVSDLRDLRDVPLAKLAANAQAGHADVDETAHRIDPADGTRTLLAAASFNSAI